MSDIALIKAKDNEEDFQFFSKCRREGGQKHYSHTLTGQTWDDVVEDARERRLYVHDFARIATYKGERAGVMVLKYIPNALYLNALHILKPFQGKGIGAFCIETILKQAEEKQLPIFLSVYTLNEPAIDFYKRLGFKVLTTQDINDLKSEYVFLEKETDTAMCYERFIKV